MPYTLTDVFAGPTYMYVDSQLVGWTSGGIKFRTNKSLWFRPSFSGMGVEEAVKQTEEFYISTSLQEATLENLRKAWGINESITFPDSASKRLDFGGSATIPTHSLKFLARDRTLQVAFYKVVAVDFGEIAYQKSANTGIPVTFRALLDTTKAVGAQIGYFIQGNYQQETILSMRVSVPMIKRKQLVNRVTTHKSSTKNLVARINIPMLRGKVLQCQITVPMIKRKQLVTRVTVA